MENENGVVVALSPVQLAALLADANISEGETLSNRLFGGLGLAGGIVEMFGAGAMCIVPEPTMLSKAGCIFVGTHSLDTVQASLRQIWTGYPTLSETYNAAVKLAEELGAERQVAFKIGMTVDLAIPMGFAFATGAVRVAAVRGGRIALATHESLNGRMPGGHTLERHIGKSPDELIARLQRRMELGEASSFRSLDEAEKLISQVLRDNKHQVEMWVKHVPQGMEARMPLTRKFSHQTGILVKRGSKQVEKCYGVRVVIVMKSYHGKPWFVLTAFPEV